MSYSIFQHICFLLLALVVYIACQEGAIDPSQDTETICGGFLIFDASSSNLKKKLDYSTITVQSFTKEMVLKESVTLANSGYYFFPVDSNEAFILKISGPYGMSFEPEQIVVNPSEGETIKELCAKDINFNFLGFSVEGQVSTFGTNEGPTGINLGLYNEKGDLLQSTLTTSHGKFKFKPIYPSIENYIIKPDPSLIEMFDKEHNNYEFKININAKNYFERALIIKGYRLSGDVFTSKGEPMKNAMVLIYSHNTTLIKDYNCKGQKSTSSELAYNSLLPFCIILTDDQGSFSFVNIPYGKFTIRAIIKNDVLSYSLSPEEKEIEIKHEDYAIKEPFTVNTFSIYGKVKNSKGNGIPNVNIKINGQVKALTDKKGVYVIENIYEGNYDLEAQRDDMMFDPIRNILLTPHLTHIQDVTVSKYKLCGQIIIEATEYFSVSRRTVILEAQSEQRKVLTDQSGKYCFDVEPSNYKVYPLLTQEEKNSDLHLQPETREIKIEDQSVSDANFYQSKVKVSGKIICLKGKCEDGIKIKLINTKNDDVQTAKIDKEKYSFEFKNIFSGQYKLAIIKPEWCWESEDLEVKVQNVDVNNMNFRQTGYSFLYSTQHDIEVECTNLDTKEKKKLSLDKTREKTCLPQEGKYSIVPNSCYKYNETSFSYDTKNIIPIEFIPMEFKTNGKIELDDTVIQMLKKENITSFPVVLKIEEVDSSNQYVKKQYKYIHLNLPNTKVFNYYFFTKPNTQFVITPSINTTTIPKKAEIFSTMLFISKDKKISVREECNEDPDEMKFSLKKGLIIKGKISEKMEGIKITALTKREKIIISSALTDPRGEYKIGPLSNEEEYELKAEKEGYKITSDKTQKYNFYAEKLSFLKVKTQDINGHPLSGVILSLSSSETGFRINNSTNSNGEFNFIDLSSGEYYIKPLYKEYQFNDPQKVIRINGGEHIEEVLVAKRVAFSIFGKVSNLNKEKVEGLYIQAKNIKTNTIQETPLDKNGEYRLRGLIPTESYLISVKISSSSIIEKALPASIPVTIGKEDTMGVDFVVLQRSKTIDVRAYVKYVDEQDQCPISKAQNVYVELSRPEEGDDKIIKTVKLSNSCQFVFRNLEKAKYHFKLVERTSKIEKVINEETVDLSDERDINNGVKILMINIENPKKNMGDNLNYTIYSPIFLFVMILSILKWDYTILFVTTYIPNFIQFLIYVFILKIKKKQF